MPDLHKNLAISAVVTAPSPATSGTSLVLTTGHSTRFPAVPFNATIWAIGTIPDPTTAEIVRVTAISTDTLTITRAQESTTARTVIVGDLIAATITAKTLTDVEGAAAKVWALIALSAGTPTVAASLNVTSVTDNGVGDYTVNFTTAFASANYAAVATADDPYFADVVTRATGSIRVRVYNVSGALQDVTLSVVAFGA